MTKKTLHRVPLLERRTLLRGMLGSTAVALGLPPLEAMMNRHGTAYGQEAAFPKRFGFFFFGDGVRLEHWNPSATGLAWELSTTLQPLANVKDYVSVVSGTDLRMSGQGHHTGQCGIATGAPYIQQDAGGAPYASTFRLPSIDQVVATHWEGENTPFRSLELGVSDRRNTREGTTLGFFSHNGPDNTNAPEYDPRAVFERLFTEGFVAEPGTFTPDPRWALRQSVLDVVTEGATELSPRLSRNDQIRLEQHLDSIRTIENKLDALASGQGSVGVGCAQPGEPGNLDGNDGETLRARTEAHSDLLAMAFACDLTRVFSMMFSGGVSGTEFPELDIGAGRHGLTHDEPDDQPQVQAGTVYIMERFATMLERLQEVPEGQGNLLDQSAIMASSDVAEGLPHSKNDYPVLVVGGAGGGLQTPGVHYRSDGQNTSDIHFTVLTALGLPVTSFGADEGESSTVISELLA